VIKILRDKKILETEARDLNELERSLFNRLYKLFTTIANLSMNSTHAGKISKIYLNILEIRDIQAILSSIANEKPINLAEAIFASNSQLVQKLINEGNSLESFSQILRNSELREASEFALKLFEMTKSISIFGSAMEFYLFKSIIDLIRGFQGEWRNYCNPIVCPIRDYYIVALAYRLKHYLPQSQMSQLANNMSCLLSKEQVEEILSTTDEEGLVNSLKRTPYLNDGILKESGNPIASLYITARRLSREASIKAFSASPFHPCSVLAIMNLKKLETDDVIIIANGIQVMMKPEKIKSMLSINVS
jgi:vacuolar-type H+-ATPase subunit C/Vma6